jgi:hypothetical protein
VNWGQCGDEMLIVTVTVTVTVGAAVAMLELVIDCVPNCRLMVLESEPAMSCYGGGDSVLSSEARLVLRHLDTYSY